MYRIVLACQGAQLEGIERALTVLGALGVCGALWAQRVVPLRGAEH
jgi:hypothetical protein